MTTDNSMFLVLPVPFRLAEGKIFVECQAANGLDRWADHFSRVTVAAPVIPEAEVRNLKGFCWRDVDTLEHRDRIVCQPLPWAYTPGPFARSYVATRRNLETPSPNRNISNLQSVDLSVTGPQSQRWRRSSKAAATRFILTASSLKSSGRQRPAHPVYAA